MTVCPRSSPAATPTPKPITVERIKETPNTDNRTNTAALLGTTFEPTHIMPETPPDAIKIRDFARAGGSVQTQFLQPGVDCVRAQACPLFERLERNGRRPGQIGF